MTSLNIESWSPTEVSQWIKGLGPQYETYSENFVDEEITGKALLTINAEYLTELSVEDVNDQNAILDAVHCLIEVDTCLKGETVFGQVVIVNDETKELIDKLEQESKDASEGDVKTSESSTKLAGHVYQLAKKILSWLIRSPFSEMNACWPLKDSVCRVVRDMTDESLLKNREHLEENLKKLQISFDNFLNEDPLHEVFKQPPILVNEEFTLEGEGLGIGITTSHHIHTVNSVTAESPAGKNGNIKNGDEIVNVNGECVIAWPQKNVITLMKSKADSVSLTLKKLPLVKGPLNKPLDKPGTPLSEMNVIMDRTKVAPERQARVEMKEAGIKEETSLEMQAIENENAAEESSKVENRIEGIKEEVENEGKQKEKENENRELENVEKAPEQEGTVEEKKENVEQDAPASNDKADENEIKTEIKDDGLVENGEVEKQEDNSKAVENETTAKEEKGDEKKAGEVIVDGNLKEENKDKAEGEKPVAGSENNTKTVPSDLETSVKSEVASGDGVDGGKVKVDEDDKGEAKEQKEEEENSKKQGGEEKVVNGKAMVETQNELEKTEGKKTEEISEVKSKAGQNDAKIEIKVDSPKKEVKKTIVTENGENVSPSKKPARPELPKMKMGSVKNVTVGGASAKQVEVYGTSKVVRREKKIDGAPSKRISCIELGEADCEGWLTKKSGGHGLTPTRWRRHWCVLKEEHLYYYKTSFDREAGGVIAVTGYNVSAAPDIKKPFSFKCEKEGAKKYFFHADNEVDREMWIKNLNSASRGERKLKETGVAQMQEAAEHKSSVSLKPAQPNRPRTSSVLAGIRFNYYDDDDALEENRKVAPDASHATTTAQRVNEGVLNGPANDTQPSTTVDENTGQNILKIAVGVEENSEPCQVIPVEEIEGDKGTNKTESESQEKGNGDEPEDESSANVDSNEDKVNNETKSEVNIECDQPKEGIVAQDVSKDNEGETSATEGTSGQKEGNEEPKGDVPAQEVSVEPSAAVETEIAKDTADSEKTNEDLSKTGEDRQTEPGISGQSEEDSEVTSAPEDATTKSEDSTVKCDDDSEKGEDVSAKCEDVSAKGKDFSAKCEDGNAECEDVRAKCEDGNGECEEVKTKSEDTTTKSEDVPECEDEAGTNEETMKDDFQAVADSIKEAEIGIDGSERSPEALLRRLSVNSHGEIMDKVVQLRVLRQNLKDKEQSVGVIDELLSSDVTPESIAEWRAKYETITTSNSSSNDLNENSQS